MIDQFGNKLLVQVTVKRPVQPGQHWFVSAPVKIPETMATTGRGVQYTPPVPGHRARWVISTYSLGFAYELVTDLIKMETDMKKEALIRWQRMIREISSQGTSIP